MTEGSRTDRGTEITLYLDDDSKEFAGASKVEGLLKKYCRFMPVPIAFGKEQEWKDGKYVETDKDKIINDTDPIWNKKPADLKKEDYMKFYRELYPIPRSRTAWKSPRTRYSSTAIRSSSPIR